MRRKWKIIVPAGLAAIALFVFLGGEVVMLLWNTLLPPLFGWPQVTFWQGLGLLALCRILFGGFGRHGGGMRSGFRGRLTDEQRAKIREKFRARCGFEPPAGGNEPT